MQLQKPNLFVSKEIKPAVTDLHYTREQLDALEGDGVRVHLIAGLSERSLPDGGWYIFCNGRLVLKADKTAASIWGSTHSMRQYHPDFAFFRGYAFFDSSVSSLLPWTTTKTGVDIDSTLYKSVQQQMIELSKPILAFLSSVTKGQKDGQIDDGALENALKGARATDIQTLTVAAPFAAFVMQRPPGPKWRRIQYSKPEEDIDRAKKMMGVNTLTEVGERSFDYFLEYEGEE